MSNLLYDEHPLIVNPTLATLIGLNEAIVLQQVHYWIEIEKKSKDIEVIEKHYHDGKWWIYELPPPTKSEMVSTIPCGIVRHVHSATTPLGKTLRHTLSVIYALVAHGN